MELRVQKLIKENTNWEELLKELHITFKEDGDYILLKYDIAADFSHPIVQECRGLILNKYTYEVACHSFDKFGNFGETYTPEIDWTTARCQAKMDGSLIKIWCGKGQWHVSTNGTIDAYKAELYQSDLATGDCPYHSFGELFDAARQAQLPSYDRLNPDCTYSFELCSKYNKVVCQYGEPTIYHIGTRNNKTNKESNPDIGVQKPIEYSLHSLQDCIEAAAHLSYDEEGYVVVDAKWNRIKVKSPAYIAAHYLKGDNHISLEKLVTWYQTERFAEVLSYVPDCASYVEKFNAIVANVVKEMTIGSNELGPSLGKSRKEFAAEVMTNHKEFSNYYFQLYANPAFRPEEWINKLSVSKFVDILEKRW